MALQKKVFSWGSYAWQSESNAYVLELTLIENSISTANNTSSITYELVLKSGDSNRFEWDLTSTLKLNGVTVASKTEYKYLDYNSAWTLLSGTTNVTHGIDGSLNMPIEVSIDTDGRNQYAPPDKTLNWSWKLTDIIRFTACTAPTSFTASPEVFEDTLTLTWAGAEGGINNAIVGYETQYRWSNDGAIWASWEDRCTETSSPATSEPVAPRGLYMQYRIRTLGAAGAAYCSEWKESNVVRRAKPNAYIHNGTKAVPHGIYIHNDTKFVRHYPYIYDGAKWVPCSE